MTTPPSSPLHWREQLQLRRSNRARHVRLKVHPDRRVELVVPRGFDERHLPALLAQHETWVARQLQRLDEQGIPLPAPVPPPRRITLAALDECWDVDYLSDDGGRYGCRMSGEGRLRVSGGKHWQQGLRRWLLRKGKAHLVPWLQQVSDELELPFSGASVRTQRSRWGSCSSRGHINLNGGLLFLPPALVRYLFVHELCHTRHLNHSAGFWQLVGQCEPDYRRLDRELRRAAVAVPGWVHASAIEAVS